MTDLERALVHLQSAYRVELDALQTEAYKRGLADLSGDVVRDAVARAIQDERFFPPVAAIREHALEALADRRRYDDQKRLEADNGTHIVADPKDGEWKTHTIPGLGSIRMFVLPDDHPALPRYKCGRCRDTGWEEQPGVHPVSKKPIFFRCACRKKAS